MLRVLFLTALALPLASSWSVCQPAGAAVRVARPARSSLDAVAMKFVSKKAAVVEEPVAAVEEPAPEPKKKAAPKKAAPKKAAPEPKKKKLSEAEQRELAIAEAKAALEAAKAEKAAALAERDAALKALGKGPSKPKKEKAPKKESAPLKLPSFKLPSVSMPKGEVKASGASSDLPLQALVGGAAVGLVPAAALISVRSFLASGRKYRE